MTLPSYYDPAHVGTLYAPQVAAATQAGIAAGWPPAERDEEKVLLLLVDAQVDFVHPDGNLAVPGAVEDTRRLVAWMYANMGRITHIAASLDSHLPLQIFFPTWWADAEGRHPNPYTVISAADVAGGRWRPLMEPNWSRDYVRRLEEDARKQLMIWPYHVLIGTPGQTLVPALFEAIAFHSAARKTQPEWVLKGTIPKTEHYSIFEPEIKVPEHPQGTLNTAFLDTLERYDLIYITGQAKSHCVLETTSSLMLYLQANERRDLIARVRLIEDTMSSVVHPE
ncbi:MAG: nicotinamidase, partial [Anaerolineae bacterium]|nr:nicotinamidase [Anaerolineae bacterium]